MIEKSFEAPPKWQTLTSLIFGFMVIFPIFIYLFVRDIGSLLATISVIIAGIFYLSGWLFGTTAFILGIMGLKYRKKALAIVAIVTSVFGFIFNMAIYNITTHGPPAI